MWPVYLSFSIFGLVNTLRIRGNNICKTKQKCVCNNHNKEYFKFIIDRVLTWRQSRKKELKHIRHIALYWIIKMYYLICIFQMKHFFEYYRYIFESINSINLTLVILIRTHFTILRVGEVLFLHVHTCAAVVTDGYKCA